MVEVAELASLSVHDSQDPERFALEEESEYEGSDSSMDLETVQVVLNPENHRVHVWATEEDIKGFVKSGLYPVEETVQYEIILEAFAFYRQDFTQLEYLRRLRGDKALYKATES